MDAIRLLFNCEIPNSTYYYLYFENIILWMWQFPILQAKILMILSVLFCLYSLVWLSNISLKGLSFIFTYFSVSKHQSYRLSEWKVIFICFSTALLNISGNCIYKYKWYNKMSNINTERYSLAELFLLIGSEKEDKMRDSKKNHKY